MSARGVRRASADTILDYAYCEHGLWRDAYSGHLLTGTAPLRRYFLQTAKSKESEGHALHGVQYFVTDKEDDHAHSLFQFTLFM